MASMTILGLPQVITAPTYLGNYMLDLSFTSQQLICDLEKEDINISLLSWPDHYVVSMKLNLLIKLVTPLPPAALLILFVSKWNLVRFL